MSTQADRLIAEARELQARLNETLDDLAKNGVVCHSVCSQPGGHDRFMPMPLTRVALVLEMKAQE